ncbi:hypothetical protein BC1G_07529 [Paecilomyces variotii No. 5]|uniref:Uncharacterized protein n=1 Tax=Byssochlamys spectabilis (strain No. 5 / NBRC 109023) TaxID=1356009 RepID=V5FPM0_BYSSN|nr:hypothetical protein BC1G_07529 [Paecilomyces variotii No. 5]
MAQLQGKVIAISGAGSGIGAATARVAAQRGASLSLADINQEGLSAVVKELKESGVNVLGTRTDISKADSVNAWIAKTIEHFGKLDGAANIAGVESLPGRQGVFDIVDTPSEHWDWVVAVNQTGLFQCIKAQLRIMQSGGSIVNISSVAGLKGYPSQVSYTASKHAVIGITRVAAKEAAASGIRVNAVAPGLVGTPMLKKLTGNYWAATGNETDDIKTDIVPLKRVCRPEEISKTICFSLSDDASYTTGTTFVVDGGLML